MLTPDRYDDYLRAACGLDLLDGPPVSLTLAQARAALAALAADAAAEASRRETYHRLLQRAVRHAQASTPNPV